MDQSECSRSDPVTADYIAESLRWVFAVPHRIYRSECVIQADEPVHRTRRLMYL